MQNWDDFKLHQALERYQAMTGAARALGANNRLDRVSTWSGRHRCNI
jgi:hypothetical protein